MIVRHIFLCPAHAYVGHHGREPGDHPMVEVEAVECVAGQGLRGDRYFGHKEDYKGQVTFFAWETYLDLAQRFGVDRVEPSAFRRNVIVEGTGLPALVGATFDVQGLRFHGVEECRPCHWMDRAVGPGAEEALRGRGGLRARILVGGLLRRGDG